MPNHVTSRLTVNGDPDEVKRLFASIENGKEKDGTPILIDFNKLIPMPESLNIESGSRGENGLVLYMAKEHGDFKGVNEMLERPWAKKEGITTFEQLYEYLVKKDPEILPLGRQYYENIQNYGCPTWYEWANHYWGTKWNAYSQIRIDENTIEFQTAWDAVPGLMEVLSKKFPTLTLSYEYADEDWGNNVGEYRFENGRCVDVNIPDYGSPEAERIAERLLGELYIEDESEDLEI